ncbi:MAG: hypothetical protein CL575_06175 [Altererythrobacter sp.]|nr:hypothetical protein [Altererythrobacter sp.]MBK62513.1 hypothetical protein [Altererythrobacter sp.]|tara:strand:+ start:150 stop:584 length:435 start_codon:yes stop_codon:yes gene_type:complete
MIYRKTPWHLSLIGLLTLLWNGFGAYDYTMTNLRDQAYLDTMGYPPEGIVYLDAFPIWAHTGWALGVWGAVLGSVLLLFRSRFALWAYVASIIGIAMTTAYEAGAKMPAELAEFKPDWFPILFWGLAIFQLWYAWLMRKRGVLR